MRLNHVTARLGSEVQGVDLSKPLSSAQTEDLYAALMDRAVLVFRDQNLSPEAHLALGEALGPLAPRHPLYPHVAGHDRIMIIRNDADNPPESDMWHTDLSCRANPPFASLLYSRIIPPVGGDTLFADMRAVHDALSEPMREMLAGLEARHSLDKGFDYLRDRDQSDRLATLNAKEQQAEVARHPVLKRHPGSGRMLVYVNQSFTEQIVGMPRAEADGILGTIYAMVHRPDFQLRIKWTPDTLVIWDNWATQHYAVTDHFPAEREMHRVTVVSDARAGAFGGDKLVRAA